MARDRNPGEYTVLTLWRDTPRERLKEWTAIGTFDSVQVLWAPPEFGNGTYRLRLASLLDSTLYAFSPAFSIQGAVPLAE